MTRIENLVAFTWLAALTIAVGSRELRSTDASAPIASPTFDRITAHRLDIVEPDGKPRVIVSNAKTYPGAFFGGKEYAHPDRAQTGGLLFYNDDGTEAGGLAYGSGTEDGKRTAGAIFTMDQRDQNEAMKLEYGEAGGQRGAGLIVFGDHPSVSLEPVFAAQADVARAKTDAEREAAQARLDRLAKVTAGESAKRVFVGREADDALVFLADKQGVPRAVLQVGASGEPSLQFFDAKGKLVKTYK